MLNSDFQFAQLNTNQHVNIQTSFLRLVGCKNFGKNIQQKFSQYIQQKYSDQPSTPCRLQKEQKAWQESLRGVSGSTSQQKVSSENWVSIYPLSSNGESWRTFRSKVYWSNWSQFWKVDILWYLQVQRVMLGQRKVGVHAETVKEVGSYFFLPPHFFFISYLAIIQSKFQGGSAPGR